MDSLFIPIIRGRSYYPQTQGLVETINKTFKLRFVAMILEIRKKDWVSALPSIIETINTTRSFSLPSYIILYRLLYNCLDLLVIKLKSLIDYKLKTLLLLGS